MSVPKALQFFDTHRDRRIYIPYAMVVFIELEDEKLTVVMRNGTQYWVKGSETAEMYKEAVQGFGDYLAERGW